MGNVHPLISDTDLGAVLRSREQGYTSWRDAKTAIFIFNRGCQLSKGLAEIRPTISAHPNCVRELESSSETAFPLRPAPPRRPGARADDAVMVFEVPA